MILRRLLSAILKNKFPLAVIFSGLGLRVYLLTRGFHVDMLSIAPWGKWIYQHGPLNFYSTQGWILSSPTQPPLANLIYAANYALFQDLNVFFVSVSTFIALNHLGAGHLGWWFDFVKWFGTTMYAVTDIYLGQLLTMKFTAIIADIIITIIIYLIGKSVKSKYAVWAAFIYFVSPFSWYISALWGQMEQLSFLFLLLSILSLNKRFFLISAILLFASIESKPTSLIFIPLYTYLFFQRKPKLIEVVLSLTGVATLFLFTAILFTDKNLLHFITSDLRDKIFFKSEYRLASESFNFWRLLIGKRLVDQDEMILFIPGKFVAYFFFSVLNIIAFWIARKKNLSSIFSSTFLVGFGGWLFLANMQERYAFSGVVFGIILLAFKPQLLKQIILICLIFSLNLYYSWGFPENLEFLRELLNWNNSILTRLIAMALLLNFTNITILLVKPLKEVLKNTSAVISQKT